MSIKTLVIEDEEKSLQVITDLMRRYADDLVLLGSSGSVDESVQLIQSTSPELVFMDIQIFDGTGFEALRKLDARDFEVIFITAHDAYAVEAFRVCAIDYLLKPIGIDQFEEAIDRARNRIREKKKQQRLDHLLDSLTTHIGQEQKIRITTINSLEFIDMKDILWCKSEGGYTAFHLACGKKLISSHNLGYYEDLLCSNDFFRIHNVSIINLRYIQSYIRGRSSFVVLTNGTQLEISQRRKSDFLDRFS